ncbi:MAG: magnesium chelatase ATPase subunit I [Betaproteobacteria bacterium]|jgi:magnesium chelatase subunit I|nr:magnesium chelatase ATPase subunit I [Pseudomonadota bacterium]NBO96699.1 magnesium chelatase ATPase subunit I [Betaproteobacteria bacterium]NBP35303.1 magnesium chelatase ATPase subunit I [Betaproteobacteria bacterium]NBP38805.1 magnesium chelatase ATPase subunit I [Betaproteobacteria bacterium]NBQ95571.1 magnesium chelatase ATPase subunit I [Betaproteobacteria bacterium]
MKHVYPFAALVGQDDMKQALLIAAVDPLIGGVLVFGDRGTGKSTAVRSLAALLPPMQAVKSCPYQCDPQQSAAACPVCKGMRRRQSITVPVPVVDLPLGATEDRVLGALDLQKALREAVKAFEPGLLAKAHRGFLYVDEVNLLEDHLVDLLLDVAASGENLVEREGLSLRHPARFVLVGSGNPEEGELRPQLLDRFGLSVDVKTPKDLETRLEVLKRRDAFDQDPAAFCARFEAEQQALQTLIVNARGALASVVLADEVMRYIATLCMKLGTDGLRGELGLMRAARALTALRERAQTSLQEVIDVAPSVLSHRLRRDPLEESANTSVIARALRDMAAA